jgi:hypothetical protein
MTNEQRRAASNLMLMCNPHHKITNDATKFPVARLRSIKQDHESKYMAGITRLQLEIFDDAHSIEVRQFQSLASYLSDIGELTWEEDKAEIETAIRELTARLQEIPIETRYLFALLVERGNKRAAVGARDLEVSLQEIESRAHLDSEFIRGHVDILRRYRLSSEPYENMNGIAVVDIPPIGDYWDLWDDLKQFCSRREIDIRELLVNLRFDLLD